MNVPSPFIYHKEDHQGGLFVNGYHLAQVSNLDIDNVDEDGAN